MASMVAVELEVVVLRSTFRASVLAEVRLDSTPVVACRVEERMPSVASARCKLA